MIGLDTNIVVRYIVQDDPVQSGRATRAIEAWVGEGKTLWICQITLCEVFWVLERCYKLPRSELIAVLSALLSTKQILVEHDAVAWQALADYEKSSVGFADCLIGRQNIAKGCSSTYSFDTGAIKNLRSTFSAMPR
jgi:predicted nucleic-acid-binding protein